MSRLVKNYNKQETNAMKKQKAKMIQDHWQKQR